MSFEHPVTVRYLEVDRQGVVFNAWYLAYLDEAMTGFLGSFDVSYPQLLARGYDVQVVHTELDWAGAARFADELRVGVSVAAIGRTSFTLAFAVRRGADTLLTARTVYVVVGADGSGKREVPDFLRTAMAAPDGDRPG
jgi:acyl-CoA thioester hydrolase